MGRGALHAELSLTAEILIQKEKEVQTAVNTYVPQDTTVFSDTGSFGLHLDVQYQKYSTLRRSKIGRRNFYAYFSESFSTIQVS